MNNSTPNSERSQTPGKQDRPQPPAGQDRLQTLPNVIQINEGQVQAHLGGLVRIRPVNRCGFCGFLGVS